MAGEHAWNAQGLYQTKTDNIKQWKGGKEMRRRGGAIETTKEKEKNQISTEWFSLEYIM